ncbi:hypothetical protein [Roseicyclus marinus]|uniref:hypothetical protein n=1 Tax=Roseicyclus marinus TaxID=2161673 RepID=UPI00240FB01E|nr:hypothetical protein [Roseicyclus marinus]MDG3041925.1 hypothetical protein [Roseicyclus marinus]
MTRPTISAPRPATGSAPVALAADLMSEFGAACCPSIAAMLERLIDRQAHPASRGQRR